MMIPSHGLLKELSLHGAFAFNSFEDICWEYKTLGGTGIVLYLPLSKNFVDFHQQHITLFHKIYCDLQFIEEDRKVLLEGNILQHNGLSVHIVENGVPAYILVVNICQKDSDRFVRLVTEGRTQIIERIKRHRTGQNMQKKEALTKEITVRSKRRHARIPKKFKIEYSLKIPKKNLENKEKYYSAMETIELQGESTNISKTGIFIKAEFLPPLGALVKVRMFTDKGQVDSHGLVVRRADEPPNSGFALEIMSKNIIEKE